MFSILIINTNDIKIETYTIIDIIGIQSIVKFFQ